MAEQDKKAPPDFALGFSVRDLPDGGLVLGTVGSEEVVLARSGDRIFAVGAHCTHYRGPLVDGALVGDTVRCPWHHACFSLRDGDVLRPPALDPIACWHVEGQGDLALVREKLPAPHGAPAIVTGAAGFPESVVIVGGGAAGLAAADTLRREGYLGPITIISADASPPCDRPSLSKEYLAGTAQDDWIPLRPPDYYAEQRIDLLLGSRVSSIDVSTRQVRIEGKPPRSFGALLIATGSDPVRLPIPGARDAQIHYLRSFADSRAIVEKARGVPRVVVVGASFIGLEVAAALRGRGIGVDVVAPDALPLARVMGPEMGRLIQQLHESHGVVFHLGQTVARADARAVTTSGGTTIDADFIVMGVGVRPAIALAESAGLALDRGVVVDEFLETSAPGIFAAGDIARWPDRHSGENIRVEHWVVAERQGQVAARNMLGRRERFDAVPFFWSQHYDVQINYVGHAERWDAVRVNGSLEAHDCAVTYLRGARRLAVATISRDRESLEAEVEMEREGA